MAKIKLRPISDKEWARIQKQRSRKKAWDKLNAESRRKGGSK